MLTSAVKKLHKLYQAFVTIILDLCLHSPCHSTWMWMRLLTNLLNCWLRFILHFQFHKIRIQIWNELSENVLKWNSKQSCQSFLLELHDMLIQFEGRILGNFSTLCDLRSTYSAVNFKHKNFEIYSSSSTCENFKLYEVIKGVKIETSN